jgi:SAM-dependent methyltransferase
MIENLGQKVESWTKEWKALSPESEIQMWDYFGLRPWILKYVPRFGKVVEAGCGLGRYNFYLSNLGIVITGLDFSVETIAFLNSWQKKHGYALDFIQGDITQLPFQDNSLSGYLSFGVMEHFIEGPHKPIKEAFRVLRPGGIAIITTPAPSWSNFYLKRKKKVKNGIKRILGKKEVKPPFFQYEYNARRLKNFIAKEGFYVSRHTGADWLFTFTEVGNYTSKYIKKNSIGYYIAHKLETGLLSSFGSQSVVIAIKPGELMHCFLCGSISARNVSLINFDVPVCEQCSAEKSATYYKKGAKVTYHNNYSIEPPVLKLTRKICSFCGTDYLTDPLFEEFGFDKPVCKNCLQKKEVNITLSNTSIQPVWRKRI